MNPAKLPQAARYYRRKHTIAQHWEAESADEDRHWHFLQVEIAGRFRWGREKDYPGPGT